MKLRDVVKSTDLLTGSTIVDGVPEGIGVLVPKQIKDAFDQNPRAVLEELLGIALYAPADQALKAIAFFEALYFSPKVPVGLTVHARDPEQIDRPGSSGVILRKAALEGMENALKDLK